jgi:hypothetical protein
MLILKHVSKGIPLRSVEVYSAVGRIENRYLLCNMVRMATRKLHKPGVPLQHTISRVLSILNARSYLRDSPGLRTRLGLAAAASPASDARSAA